MLIWLVHRFEALHTGLIEKHCQVPAEKILEGLSLAKEEAPFTEELNPERDFSTELKSEARSRITSHRSPTANQLQRRLGKLQDTWGKKAGAAKMATQLGQPRNTCPQLAIAAHMEEQFSLVRQELQVTNHAFDPCHVRPSPPPPLPLKLPGGCRHEGKQITVVSAFSGSNAIGTSLTDTGLAVVKAVCEHHPTLLAHSKAMHPQAQCYLSVRRLRKDKHRYRYAVYQSSPPCPAHSTANTYRKGNMDTFGGMHWEESARYVKHLKPAIAHLECTLGVTERHGGKPSPMQALRAALQKDYWITELKVDAGRTTSPLTGRQSALQHRRMHVLLWKKTVFRSPPKRPAVNATPPP